MRLPHGGCPVLGESLLNLAQLGRLQDHRRIAIGLVQLDNKFMLDISGVVEVRKATVYIPTLVKNSMSWSEVLGREALVEEHLLCQGIPAVLGIAQGPFICSLTYLIRMPLPGGISDAQARALAGLAMHMTLVRSLFSFMMSHIEANASASSMRFHRMQSVFVASVDSDAEEDIE